MKNLLIYSLVIAGVVLTSCKKDEPEVVPPPASTSQLNGVFENNLDDARQYFSINASIANQFTGANGVVVTIPANSFEDANGNPVSGIVNVELIEILDQSTMILLGMPTTSNGEILFSGGQIKLTAYNNGGTVYLADNASVSIMVPAANPDIQMQLFQGIEDNNGDVDWILSVDDSTSVPDSLLWVPDSTFGSSGGYYWFTWPDSTLGWINCDYFWDDPNPVTTLFANLDAQYNSTNTMVFLHFSSINSIGQMYWDGSTYFTTSGLPVSTQLTIVCVSEMDGDYFSAFVPVTVSSNLVVPVGMTPTTLTDFETAVINL